MASSAAASQASGTLGNSQAGGYSATSNQSASAAATASKSTTNSSQTSTQQQQQQAATVATVAKAATSAGTSGDPQSQGPDGEPQANGLSPLTSLVTPNGKSSGLDSTTQSLRNSAVLVLFPPDLAFGRPAGGQGPVGGEPGPNQLLSNGSSALPPGGMAALQAAVSAAQAQASQRELQVLRAGASSDAAERATLLQARTQDGAFEQYLGGPDSLLHYSAALQPELLPQVGTVTAGVLSADLPAIGRGVDQFFAQLDGLADDLSSDLSTLQVGLWLAAASGAVAGLELVRRRGRPVPGLAGGLRLGTPGLPPRVIDARRRVG